MLNMKVLQGHKFHLSSKLFDNIFGLKNRTKYNKTLPVWICDTKNWKLDVAFHIPLPLTPCVPCLRTGDTTTDVHNGSQYRCAVTRDDENPSAVWRVDLQATYRIGTIVITAANYGSTFPHPSNFQIRIGDFMDDGNRGDANTPLPGGTTLPVSLLVQARKTVSLTILLKELYKLLNTENPEYFVRTNFSYTGDLQPCAWSRAHENFAQPLTAADSLTCLKLFVCILFPVTRRVRNIRK